MLTVPPVNLARTQARMLGLLGLLLGGLTMVPCVSCYHTRVKGEITAKVLKIRAPVEGISQND